MIKEINDERVFSEFCVFIHTVSNDSENGVIYSQYRKVVTLKMSAADCAGDETSLPVV